MAFDKQLILGKISSVRNSNKMNLFILVVAFLACIYSINNYNQCTANNVDNNKYQSGFTKFSYVSSILLLTFFCILFVYDLYSMFKKH